MRTTTFACYRRGRVQVQAQAQGLGQAQALALGLEAVTLALVWAWPMRNWHCPAPATRQRCMRSWLSLQGRLRCS